MNIIASIIDFLLNLNIHLGEIISTYGTATYIILFIVVFVETGLVFLPFLPGDSLLFVAGAFAALGSLNIFVLMAVLMVAAIAGDTVNYWIGRFLGKKIIASKKFHVYQKFLVKTQEFFKKHGGKTIVLARFVPVIRTFTPFVAGIGNMHYGRFLAFNIIGAILWVFICTLAGYFFGNIPIVKDNFSLFVGGIVVVSLIPVVIQFIRERIKKIKPVLSKDK
jgi:membrane-associated protein